MRMRRVVACVCIFYHMCSACAYMLEHSFLYAHTKTATHASALANHAEAYAWNLWHRGYMNSMNSAREDNRLRHHPRRNPRIVFAVHVSIVLSLSLSLSLGLSLFLFLSRIFNIAIYTHIYIYIYRSISFYIHVYRYILYIILSLSPWLLGPWGAEGASRARQGPCRGCSP